VPELCTIYDYMRAHAALLGQRILQEYPALHQFDDPVSPRIEALLRKPFPAQTIAIMGVAKRWQQVRTAGSRPQRPVRDKNLTQFQLTLTKATANVLREMIFAPQRQNDHA